MNGNTAQVREVLERPFAPELIKQRPGSFGNSLSYVEGAEYVRRLNEAFNGDWSFEIVKHEVDEKECIVVGKLIADNIIKMAFGGTEIKRHKDNGEIICLSDDLKAAATDALKKASSFLGVGLHLYTDKLAPVGTRTESGNGNGSGYNGGNGHSRPTNRNGNGNGSGYHQGNGNNRLTSRQLAAIFAIGKDKGLNREKLNGMSLERFNANLEFLLKNDASSFIQELQDM